MNEIKQNPSIYGYFNWREARAVVLAAVGADAFTQLGLTILVGLLKSSDTIYAGPNAAVITQICGTLAALLAGYVARAKLVKQGH